MGYKFMQEHEIHFKIAHNDLLAAKTLLQAQILKIMGEKNK